MVELVSRSGGTEAILVLQASAWSNRGSGAAGGAGVTPGPDASGVLTLTSPPRALSYWARGQGVDLQGHRYKVRVL